MFSFIFTTYFESTGNMSEIKKNVLLTSIFLLLLVWMVVEIPGSLFAWRDGITYFNQCSSSEFLFRWLSSINKQLYFWKKYSSIFCLSEIKMFHWWIFLLLREWGWFFYLNFYIKIYFWWKFFNIIFISMIVTNKNPRGCFIKSIFISLLFMNVGNKVFN